MLRGLQDAGCTAEELADFRAKLTIAEKPDSSYLCVPCHEQDGLDDALVALDIPVPELEERKEPGGLSAVLEQIMNFKHLAMTEDEQ